MCKTFLSAILGAIVGIIFAPFWVLITAMTGRRR